MLKHGNHTTLTEVIRSCKCKKVPASSCASLACEPATGLAGNLLRASFQSHYNWAPSATATGRCKQMSPLCLGVAPLSHSLSLHAIPLHLCHSLISPILLLMSAGSLRGGDRSSEAGLFPWAQSRHKRPEDSLMFSWLQFYALPPGLPP